MTLKPVDTAIIMVVGPCIDDTDFKTLEEGIAYNAAGMDISLIIEKTDGTSTTTAITLTTGGTSDWIHKDGGYYEVEITATQNAEEGIAYLRGVCTGVLPFESSRYEIVKANVYDSLIKGTDTLQTDIIQIGGVVQSLTDFKDMIDSGYDPATHKIQSDLIYIHGTALTETDGQLAAAFKKLFDVTTPLLVSSDVMRGTDGANTTTPPTVIAIREEMDSNSTKMAPSQTLADYKATGFSTHSADNVWSVGTRILTANTNFNDLSASAINTEVATALAAIKLDHLINIGVDTNWATTVHLDSVIGQLADVGSTATFDRTTDSQEALRNRGDAAWVTGGGGAITDILNIQTLIPYSIDLADTAIIRIGLGLTNMVDDLPTTTEITPGTITIDRKAIGGTSWTNVVNTAACSELTGLIYYDEVFDNTTGYAAGDSIRITFKSQKITVDANDFEITGTDGWVFQTHIRESMVGTTGAYTGTPPTVIQIRQEMDSNSTKMSPSQVLNDYKATGFNTTTPPTVIAIREEMDSNSTKMAPSQTLADYKATGFSTHSADNVWSVVTRSLTDKGGFSLSTAGIKAIWDQLTSALITVGSIGKLLVDNVNATISSRSPSSEYDTEMGRLDVNVSSRNSVEPNTVIPDVAGTAAILHGITDGKIDVMDAIVDAIKSKTDNLPSGITKNEALPKFDFLMVLTSDHITSGTGKTVTGTISKNGGAFTVITNTITEVANGMYTIADGFTQTEMNADVITLQFAADDCDTRIITLLTNYK